jgi:nucleotide-binding universal stress UspA family protein
MIEGSANGAIPDDGGNRMSAADGVIVVGVDGSASGLEAIEWAAGEARLRGATLRAVHAWEVPPLTVPGVSPSAFVHARDEWHAAATQLLDDALARSGASLADVAVERSVVQGQAAHALVSAAAGAELLVVGSHGHGRVGSLVLGSVSQQCLHHARCPIAVVHRAHHGDRRRIVVGVDGSPGAARALAWAEEEAARRGTSLLAVCAYHEPSSVAASGAPGAGALAELHEGLMHAAGTVLADAERSVTRVPVATSAVHGRAADAILAAASDSEIVVVGSRGRGGFASLLLGSVSQHCAARAPGVAVVVPSSRD